MCGSASRRRLGLMSRPPRLRAPGRRSRSGRSPRRSPSRCSAPMVHVLAIDGGNMEGKETRFGIALSALFAVITTAASCGAVNAMHDSFTALGGFIPLINIQLGEIIVGGVGAGMYGMLLFV